MRIAISLVATNSYFVLGIRFMKRFMHHYKGNAEIRFYLFTDTDPVPYLPEGFPVQWFPTMSKDWVEGTNSKFRNIYALRVYGSFTGDYIFQFDADTNITKDFDESWFVGLSVGGEHYGNRAHMATEGRPYDRNPKSQAYIPHNTPLPQMYYYGAFFGGSRDWMLAFAKEMIRYQELDKAIHYEPAVNDESFLNRYFHYYPPAKVVASQDFQFDISDKGGLENTRDPLKDVSTIRDILKAHPTRLFDIKNGQVILQ